MHTQTFQHQLSASLCDYVFMLTIWPDHIEEKPKDTQRDAETRRVTPSEISLISDRSANLICEQKY